MTDSNILRDKDKKDNAFTISQQRKLLDLFNRTEDKTITFGVFLDEIKRTLKLKGSSDYEVYWRRGE